MTRRSEIDWLYRGVGAFFPAQWQALRAGVPFEKRDGDLVAAYYELLHDPDPVVRNQAAADWCAWEDSIVSIDENHQPEARRTVDRWQMAFARIVTHYFHHKAWLAEEQLLRNAHQLANIPGIMVQGRIDFGGPLVTAWQLAQALPAAELVIIPGAGHSFGDAGMLEAIIAATNRFRS